MRNEKTNMCTSKTESKAINENKSTKVKNTKTAGEGFKSAETNCTNRTNPNTTSRG